MTGSEYLDNLDLKVFFERKDINPFIVTLFHHVEGPLMKEALGFGFTHEICLMKNNFSQWIFSKEDLDAVHKKHNLFLQNKSLEKIKSFFDKAYSVYEGSDIFLNKIATITEEEFVYQLSDILDKVKEILFYTTTMPFFLLNSTEEEYGVLEKEKKSFVIEKSEKLRADSKYNSIQEILLNRFFDIFSKKYNLTKEQINNLTYGEIKSFAESGSLHIDKNLGKRMKMSVFWIDPISFDNHHFLYEENFLNELYSRFNLNNDLNIKQINGQVANKGYAKGVVRIINSPKEINKLKEGEILFSRNTNPSLMPAIIKAGAIVTDEGGIGCHAAIVSREMNKPCVIGTKIATKVLNDGDLVEVDADNGIVKII